MNNIVLEKAAQEVVKSENNILVQAGPGAGKTELLAQKAFYIFENKLLGNNKKILAISFKKDSAENLKKRIFERCGAKNSDRFYSMTFDSFCKMLIDRFINGIPLDYRPTIDYSVLTNGVQNTLSDIYVDILKEKLSQNQIKTLTKKVETANLEKLSINDSVYHIWRKLIKSTPSRLTFKMINCLAIFLLTNNKYLIRAIQNTFEYVFLDEFQDTTELQYGLVEKIFLNSKTKLIAVGDYNQRIMLWAGADIEVFKKFQKNFNADKKTLLMNYRSTELLVNFQKTIYSILNDNDKSNDISSWMSEDNKGEIVLLEFKDDEKEAEEISNIIYSKIKDGIYPKDICILVKQKPQNIFPKIKRKLEEKDINSRIEDDYQNLIKENIVKLILTCLSVMYDMQNKESWEVLVEFLGDNINLKKLAEIDRELIKLKHNNPVFKAEKFNELVDRIVDILDKDRLRAEFVEYRNGVYLDDVINGFKNLFIHSSSKVLFDERIKDFLGENSVAVMTIHKSKGLEYNTVIFVGLEDEFFWSFKTQPDEDKCAFFVALSRAKENLYFTFTNYRNNSSINRKHNEINEIYSLISQNNSVIKKIY